jgi:hypothetical protein
MWRASPVDFPDDRLHPSGPVGIQSSPSLPGHFLRRLCGTQLPGHPDSGHVVMHTASHLSQKVLEKSNSPTCRALVSTQVAALGFTLPRQGRGGACDDAGRGCWKIGQRVRSRPFPFPKVRASPSTLPKEGEGMMCRHQYLQSGRVKFKHVLRSSHHHSRRPGPSAILLAAS